jgi:hypothetical protein
MKRYVHLMVVLCACRPLATEKQKKQVKGCMCLHTYSNSSSKGSNISINYVLTVSVLVHNCILCSPIP